MCVLQSTAKERAKHAGDYFTLLRLLLNYAYNSNINLPNAEVLLNNQIDWLKRIRVRPRRRPTCTIHFGTQKCSIVMPECPGPELMSVCMARTR